MKVSLQATKKEYLFKQEGKQGTQWLNFRKLEHLERLNIGEFWNISDVPVKLGSVGVIQKLTILECKNGLVLPVSMT